MEFNRKIEEIIRCENLGVDYSAFESAEELIRYLDGRDFGFDKPLCLTGKMKREIRKIFAER